ncbi:conserved membrane hypothetical protein [Candidatus Roizmanbacteria bacterium]|nr:conserved membrane hypothetical protein [Candidatus Roizmanbacteria bacterium]
MMYSPLINLYSKYEKHVHDFIIQLFLIFLTYLIDWYIFYYLRINLLWISLFVFIIGFLFFRFVIKSFRMQKLFGGFVNYGLWYPVFLGFSMWLIYFFMIRVPKFR